MIKRITDILATLLASPLVLLIGIVMAFLIWLTDGRPILFAQQRAGKNMKPFTLYKFRTMKNTADPFGPSPKEGSDPRVTKIGRFLRLSSLDELPQLWNVLKGEMSLVGPRPLYVQQAQLWNQRQKRRLEVKPGLTGLAQISGRGSLTIEEKLEIDVQYVEKQSLWLDIKIIFATVFHILKPQGIYEKQYSATEKTRGDAAKQTNTNE